MARKYHIFFKKSKFVQDLKNLSRRQHFFTLSKKLFLTSSSNISNVKLSPPHAYFSQETNAEKKPKFHFFQLFKVLKSQIPKIVFQLFKISTWVFFTRPNTQTNPFFFAATVHMLLKKISRQQKTKNRRIRAIICHDPLLIFSRHRLSFMPFLDQKTPQRRTQAPKPSSRPPRGQKVVPWRPKNGL